MYCYYACCTMKWTFPLPKQFMTWLQMIQFVSGLCVYGTYYFVDEYWREEETRFVFLFTYAYVLMNLIMFVNFYMQTYMKGRKKKLDDMKEE